MGGDLRVAIVILAGMAAVAVLMLLARIDAMGAAGFGVEVAGLLALIGIGE